MERLGRGRKPAPRADLIGRDRRYRLGSREHGRLVYGPPSDPAGTWDPLLDYKPGFNAPLSLRPLREPAPSPAVSTGNRNSAQLGYQACRQRKACLFENRLV